MPNEFPMNDPRNIWQNQPAEKFKMSADQLRRKALQRQSKARLEALLAILLGVTLCVFFAWTFATAGELLLRLGLGVLSLWCLYYAYQAYQWIWPRRLESDAALGATLHAYRSELEKRRDYVRHIWRRAGLPFCFFGLALIIVPELIKALAAPRLVFNVLPVCVLLAIWLAIFLPQRKRRQRNLQQEIDQLRALEGESQS
jgi:hypothetical protein